jgi:hypothetical protein
MEIIVTTQLYSTLDNRFRHLADYVVEAHRQSDGFLYRVMSTELRVRKNFFLPLGKAQWYYTRYDTMERVKPVEQMQDVKRITTPPAEKFASAEEYASEVLTRVRSEFGPNQKPTHDLVDFYCEALQVPSYLHKMVYIVANKEFKKYKKEKKES